MKTRYLKVISAILALLMMASVMVIPSFAADELEDYALLQSYGFKYQGSKDVNVIVRGASIDQDSQGSSYLKVDIGDAGESYPVFFLNSNIIPTNLTNYT